MCILGALEGFWPMRWAANIQWFVPPGVICDSIEHGESESDKLKFRNSEPLDSARDALRDKVQSLEGGDPLGEKIAFAFVFYFCSADGRKHNFLTFQKGFQMFWRKGVRCLPRFINNETAHLQEVAMDCCPSMRYL